MEKHLISISIWAQKNSETNLPKKMLSERMIDPIIATIIIVNGLNAAANTGPFTRMHNPCT